ncbi:MAG TPA: endolytic transglycosylase MltG [Gemmatimonadaceae bacterium]|nr:endolytic transglycosylase MltG [Gemmatimonadaceae bacterium]
MPSTRRRRPARTRNDHPARARLSRVLALVFTGVVLLSVVMWFTRTPSDDQPPVRLLIPRGASFREAAESLAAHQLIRYPRVFSTYASMRGRDRTIRAGTYTIARGQGWDELIHTLHTGRGAVAIVTIVEGWSLRTIVPHLAEALLIPVDSVNAAVRDMSIRTRLKIPTTTLEGYLFPDTYEFAVGSTARQVIAVLVARFERAWKPEWDARLIALRRTRHDIVTLASIVEKEVRVSSERPIVAGVYWNRLRANMFLQADPTVRYAANKYTGRVLYSDLNVKSPYNTYRNPGLPPGPIASPGEAALEATMNPARVPYRFFVAAPDGHHEFRRTFAEHAIAVQQMRALFRAEETRRARGSDTARVRIDTTKDSATATGRRGGT